MKDLIAKRYVKALVDGRDLSSVTLISEKLSEVSKAFSSDKFNSILASSDINEVEKTKFVLSIIDNADKSLENFINLLGEKRRLDIIPQVAFELKTQIAKMNSSYVGTVYTNKELSKNYISSIEEQFSKNLM